LTVTERDKRIIKDIEKFRALSRDQIGKLHFNNNKEQIKTVNFVMNRLKKRGYVKADESKLPYVYTPSKGGLRRGSQKIDHFVEIANVYLDLRVTGDLRRFNVEPKLGDKGTVEPDAFAIWMGWPWFIEVQLSNYSDAIMRKKLKRYEAYHNSYQWSKLDWQPKEPLFPRIWIISNRKYDVTWLNDVKIFQTKTVSELI
jgi:hypothetical protein